MNVSGDSADDVDQVVYSVDKQSPVPATDAGNQVWTVPLDVGTLSNDPHTLTVTAEDADGATVGSPAYYSITMQNTLNIATLTTTSPEGVPVGVDATTLRFVADIPLVPAFSGTLSDLPIYYANTEEIEGSRSWGQSRLSLRTTSRSSRLETIRRRSPSTPTWRRSIRRATTASPCSGSHCPAIFRIHPPSIFRSSLCPRG